MARNLNILEELKSLDAVILCNNIAIPYTVPNTYWEDLAHWSSLMHLAEPNMGINIGTDIPFDIPNGYFDDFASNMLSLLQNNSLNKLSKEMPYTLDAAYFDQQINSLNSFYFNTHSVGDELAIISNINHNPTNPYILPEAYFDTLTSNILSKVALDVTDNELEEAPLLASLKGKNPFETPSFDSIKIPVAEPIAPANNTIAFEPKKSQNNWWKKISGGIAAALVIGLGINTLNNDENVGETAALTNNLHEIKADSILNSLSGESIENYIAMHDEDFVFTYQMMQEDETRIHAEMDALLDNMNDSEIEELINNL